MYKKEYNFYLVLLALLVINLFVFTNFKTTGQAYTFPVGQPHTIYNLLQGISTDSSGYRFVVPDDASTMLIGAVANLSSKLNFAGNATITDLQYRTLYPDEKNIIYLTYNTTVYGSTYNQIKISESAAKTIMFVGSNTTYGLVNLVKDLIFKYDTSSNLLNSSCVDVWSYYATTPCYTAPTCLSDSISANETVLCPDTDSGLILKTKLKNYFVNLTLLKDTNYDLRFDIIGRSPVLNIITKTCSQNFTVDMDTDEYFIITRKGFWDGETEILQLSRVSDIDGITIKDYLGTVVAQDKKLFKTFDVADMTLVVLNYSQVGNYAVLSVPASDGACADDSILTADGLEIKLPSNVAGQQQATIDFREKFEEVSYGWIGSGTLVNTYTGFNFDADTTITNVSGGFITPFQKIGSTNKYEAYTYSNRARWVYDKSTNQYSAKVEYKPASQMITCNDSDGLNYYIKGAAVNSSGGYYPDYCSSSTNIVEYICSPKFGISESRFTCPYICSNGTCQSQPSTCTDSDGGFNYYTKGNISGYLANESRNYVYNDYCAGGPNNTYLSETYCNGTNPLSLIYVCPYGCSNSVCVQPTAPAISSTINQIKTTQNNLGYKNVIGSSAVQDNIAAIDLAGFLKINNTLTASDIGTPITIPAIVIGGPCVNQKAAVLLNLSYPSCEYNSTIPQNHGIIRTFNNNNKTQILVAGWNAIDTRIAARAVVRYLEFYSKLNTSNATTYGNNLENVTVN